MATREKKTKTASSDSPSPSEPTTPRSKGKPGRKPRVTKPDEKEPATDAEKNSEIKEEKTEAVEEEPKKEEELKKDDEPKKDEAKKEEPKKEDSSKEGETPTPTRKKPGRKPGQKIVQKPVAPSDRVLKLKTGTAMKRRSLPVTGRPVLGKSTGRKSTGSLGKAAVEKIKKEENKNTMLRNGKTKSTNSPERKKRSRTNEKEKEGKDENSEEKSETESTKIDSRRRSDSVSKCSDTTDTSYLSAKDEPMSSTPTKEPTDIRRSKRKRKSQLKEDFITPKPRSSTSSSTVAIKTEPEDPEPEMDGEESIDSVKTATPLTVDTEGKIASPVTEKAASLSPELISEGVSEISVKEYFDEPAFLENNVGIEKDPKLGEIVQGQEKIKLDKVIECDIEAKNVELIVESAVIEPVVVGETDEKAKPATNDDVKPEIDIEPIKEIIGKSEPPTEAAEEIKVDNEILKTDDDKEAKIDVPEKDVTCNSNKNDQASAKKAEKSDSDGERPAKSATPKLKTVKDGKPKTRQPKEKSKEDEQARLEKLRQEKLRVEEKVREEKMRAEMMEKMLLENGEKVSELNKKDLDSDNKENNVKMESVEILVAEKIVETLNDVSNSPKSENEEKIEAKVVEAEEKLEKMEVADENKENSVNVDIEIDSKNDIITNESVVISPVMFHESEEQIKQKECHLKSLGLLTIQEADAEKQRRIQNKPLSTNSSSSSTSSAGSSHHHHHHHHKPGKTHRRDEYTGTLKTVIKINRNDKRKTREPLKITFQKGKTKSTDRDSSKNGDPDDIPFYTIQNESDGQMTENSNAQQGRKSHNRSHTTDGATAPETDTEGKAIVIPEKASSFKVHPGRLCQDQCFYCGGKFGLYDTPCHIAAMKSVERQKKILASEVKITSDSCLCDACFRHVDRKANCPSYRKRTSPPSVSPLLIKVPQNHDLSSADEKANSEESETEMKSHGTCHVKNCQENASHTIRRKWLIKMKRKISKHIQINLDNTNVISNLIPICDQHYEMIDHLLLCALCKRRLPKNHIFYISNDLQNLEKLIQEQGIAVGLGTSTLVVCKLCRYYANLLLKPPEAKSQKAQFIKNYNKRLLQHYEKEQAQAEENYGNQSVDEDILVTSLNDNSITIRKRRRSKRSPDVSISDGASTIKEKQLDEITILPARSSVPITGHIQLDNDVMVDYDPPMMDYNMQEKNRKQARQNSESNDMTKVLKSNPNISMRELFPGEEELGINIHIPFGTQAPRTPEGWAKVTTVLQYDDGTRALWEDLQKPYGNQSSFLRHLILLEKYFRNGDLILSPQAKTNAITYSESVQNRLRSFDNIPTPPPINVIDKNTIMKQLGNSSITIMPASSKQKTKSIAENVTLLKTNNTNGPASATATGGEHKRKMSHIEKISQQLAQKQEMKIPKLDETTIVPKDKSATVTPPELISLNKQSPAKQSIGQNVTITSVPAQTQVKSPTQRDIIHLPNHLTPQERKQAARPWRPTLIPITPGSAEDIKKGPLYQTADGRRLPSLVQVMSGGKPYHISIFDYNRMCILRREKLLQQQMMQQKMMQQTTPPPSATKTTPQKKSTNETSNSSRVNIPTQILEQNSLIPLNNSSSSNDNSNKNNNLSELQQLIKTRKLPKDGGKSVSLDNNLPMLYNNLGVAKTSTTTSATQSPIDALIKHNSLFLNNSIMQLPPSSSTSTTLSSNIMSNTSGGSILIDNSAASLLSKIPKSLTVIPQKSLSRDSSTE